MKGKAPVVTGISPKEGVPGTQIIIRGENLGQSQNDLIGLFICGTDCSTSARWESSHKIIARCGQAKGGYGEIVVYTKAGGKGSSTVSFRVFTVQIGPLQESAVWVDESRSVNCREEDGAAAPSLVDDDPLGISNDRDQRTVAEASLPDMFPDGSGNLRLENFSSIWYLLENHQRASLEDLKMGLSYMEQEKNSTRGGPQELLKTNLHSFLNCVDSLAAMHRALEKDKNMNGWPFTEKLDNQICTCRKQANELFSDVLGRKERADGTRSALSVLQRFRFLFFLPSAIRANLEKGEYAIIWNDYTRAKSLFGQSEVPLFKEAFAEVEKQMAVLKQSLEQRLVEMPASLEEQKKVVRYLLMLDPEADPGWDCIFAHHHWLQGLLWDAQQKIWTTAKQEMDGGETEADDSSDNFIVQHRFVFVESLIRILNAKLQHFWRLGLAYVNGQLSSKQNLHREEEIVEMGRQTVNLASWLVLNALLPESLPPTVRQQYTDRFVIWATGAGDDTLLLLQALKSIRELVSSLHQQDLQGRQLAPLMELTVTLRVKCLNRVVEKTGRDVRALTSRENWRLVAKEGDFSKTRLPDMFETQVSEALPLVRGILARDHFPDEPNLFADRLGPLLVQTFQKLLCSFKDTLWVLSRLGPGGGPGRPNHLPLDAPERKDTLAPLPIKDKKLLIALSNCDYVLRYSLSSLTQKLASNGVQNTEPILKNCQREYEGFLKTLESAYTTAKCGRFQELLTVEDYTGIVEAAEQPSNSVKDLVLCVVSVQAELFLVAPRFAARVLDVVLRFCVQRLSSVFRSIRPPSTPAYGITKAVLDAKFFEEAVSAYLSPESKVALTESWKHLETAADQKAVAANLDSTRKKMRLMFLSLKGTDDLVQENNFY